MSHFLQAICKFFVKRSERGHLDPNKTYPFADKVVEPAKPTARELYPEITPDDIKVHLSNYLVWSEEQKFEKFIAFHLNFCHSQSILEIAHVFVKSLQIYKPTETLRVSEGRLVMLEEKWREGAMTVTLAEKIVHLLRKNLSDERVCYISPLTGDFCVNFNIMSVIVLLNPFT